MPKYRFKPKSVFPCREGHDVDAYQVDETVIKMKSSDRHPDWITALMVQDTDKKCFIFQKGRKTTHLQWTFTSSKLVLDDWIIKDGNDILYMSDEYFRLNLYEVNAPPAPPSPLAIPADELFTRIPFAPPKIDHTLLFELTFENFEARIGDIRKNIEEIEDYFKQHGQAGLARRKILSTLLLRCPSNSTTTGRLTAAAGAMMDYIAPNCMYTAPWGEVFRALKKGVPQSGIYSESTLRKEIEFVKQREKRELGTATQTSKARAFLLARITTNQEDPRKDQIVALLREGKDAAIVDYVESILYDVYVAENFPDGKEVDIGCCSECSLWICGEDRCSCHNVRISLNTSGSFILGTGYAYPDLG